MEVILVCAVNGVACLAMVGLVIYVVRAHDKAVARVMEKLPQGPTLLGAEILRLQTEAFQQGFSRGERMGAMDRRARLNAEQLAKATAAHMGAPDNPANWPQDPVTPDPHPDAVVTGRNATHT